MGTGLWFQVCGGTRGLCLGTLWVGLAWKCRLVALQGEQWSGCGQETRSSLKRVALQVPHMFSKTCNNPLRQILSCSNNVLLTVHEQTKAQKSPGIVGATSANTKGCFWVPCSCLMIQTGECGDDLDWNPSPPLTSWMMSQT